MLATVKQVNFLRSLLNDRDHDMGVVDFDRLSVSSASTMISLLISRPRKATGTQVPASPRVTECGMYRVNDEIFKVQKARGTENLYAKRLVKINGDRLTNQDEIVHFEFQYEQGAIKRIRPEHRMTLDQAKEFGIRYGVCCVCGASLKDATSVANGIGPVCAGKV